MQTFLSILQHNKWAGYLLITGIIVYFSYYYIKNPGKLLGIYGILTSVGLLYPTTKIAQYFIIGPRWYRGYFADIGFVPFMSLMLFIFTSELFLRKIKYPSINVKIFSQLMLLKYFTFFVSIIAMLHEAFQLTMQVKIGSLSGIKDFTGRGDYVDLFIFFIMLILQVWVIDHKKNKYIIIENQNQKKNTKKRRH